MLPVRNNGMQHSCNKAVAVVAVVPPLPVGQEEVEAAVRLLDDEARKLARSRLKYKLMPAPLYAGRERHEGRACVFWGGQEARVCVYVCVAKGGCEGKGWRGWRGGQHVSLH